MSGKRPYQYELGQWEFYGITLKVGEGVLIPQPDTETIVDLLRNIYKKNDSLLTGADFCSGTGCIALALEKYLNIEKLYAVEKYNEAYNFLLENIKLNNSKVIPVLHDIKDTLFSEKLDFIVSNPPYITEEEMKELPWDVLLEPHTALLGGKDGLSFYPILCQKGQELLKDNGLLAVEVGYQQSKKVQEIFKKYGYKNIGIEKDLPGIERVVYGTK